MRAGHAFINAIMAGTPVVTPQLSADFSPGTLCQIETDNAVGQMQEQDMLSQNVQGYESDHTADLELYDGLYYKDDALGVPVVPDLKSFVLRELRDANHAGHVGYHRIQHDMQRCY